MHGDGIIYIIDQLGINLSHIKLENEQLRKEIAELKLQQGTSPTNKDANN